MYMENMLNLLMRSVCFRLPAAVVTTSQMSLSHLLVSLQEVSFGREYLYFSNYLRGPLVLNAVQGLSYYAWLSYTIVLKVRAFVLCIIVLYHSIER